jgi:hypothetical protein
MSGFRRERKFNGGRCGERKEKAVSEKKRKRGRERKLKEGNGLENREKALKKITCIFIVKKQNLLVLLFSFFKIRKKKWN